jgi:threonine dehydrogenase-like Zn-dependent dehydrogenase
LRALTFEGIRDVRVATVPDPRLEAPGDAIVRIRHTAVCGSDLHVYRGLETGLDPGTPMGHEMVGQVIETGRGVAGFRPGDLVVAPFTTCCGACFYCRSGLPARCPSGQLFGWVERGEGLAGVQAEYARVPLADSTLVAVPEGTPADLALLAGDVLATGWFAAESAGAAAGATVAVVGCGPVGLMAVIAARELGAGRIFAVDLAAERLALAGLYGAEALAAGPEAADPIEAVRAATEGRGADAVVEAVGNPEATRLAFELVRPGGTIAAVGVHTEGQLAFRPGEAYDKNLTYRAGRASPRRYMERLLPLLGAGRYDFGALVSHRLPLADAARGYDLFDRRLEGCTKVLLAPGEG